MDKAIEKILKDIEFHEKELEKLKKALAALQEVCEHPEEKQIYLGNNHNNAIYECKICKKRFYE